MSAVLWIGIGGALGSVARYLLAMSVDRALPGLFPWGTLVCNVVGCFLIGLLTEVLVDDRRMLLSPEARQGVMVGLLGGFTTFSTFGLQTMKMVETEGAYGWAVSNVAMSITFCLVGVWLGSLLGAAIRRGG